MNFQPNYSNRYEYKHIRNHAALATAMSRGAITKYQAKSTFITRWTRLAWMEALKNDAEGSLMRRQAKTKKH